MSGVQVFSPTNVVEAPGILISEFFGRVASGDPRLSACTVTVKKASEEAWQTPEFDEYVLVLSGCVELKFGDGKTAKVAAKQGAFLPRGTRVKWVWPGPCEYIPICLPAFSPENCGREDEKGNHMAKSSEAMQKLRELHEESCHPWLFHVAQKSLWEKAKKEGKPYKPPTYEQDGFTHATADPTKLTAVLNHFYKKVPGEWVCLRMSKASLSSAGVETVFEKTAPVGDIPSIDMGDQLFPHIQGGIPPSSVLEEFPVVRGEDGSFLSIPGVTEGAGGKGSGSGEGTGFFMGVLCGLSLGLGLAGAAFLAVGGVKLIKAK
uniref:(S)-ureidoglycine aminohydrolase cupin domain-containing protein n=1 Tax=Chromera velia CCMP2878 TaxID=1169474 RepID=A0A0G4HCU8_9ALVE|eukprot:Cvel_6314.t1-p1 / transcript=Cvel_6314.t1 / gene=Cvel_6314 / organism=Chromera_velia_CCMP2878 / gene_product=Endoribonuclease YbeY, putative / transcript_product=Endoribonuclease YbeY, putative / location=Cvel_scaffold306:55799-57921(+) / protein_length=318 / sequence_SO=supercontig / SO=protein_coding / is_pseudo=false